MNVCQGIVVGCIFLYVICVCVCVFCSAKQQADDIKAIERAKFDMQRVQSQLVVVQERTSAVRTEHYQLTLTFQSDELRMTSLETDLKVSSCTSRLGSFLATCLSLSVCACSSLCTKGHH